MAEILKFPDPSAEARSAIAEVAREYFTLAGAPAERIEEAASRLAGYFIERYTGVSAEGSIEVSASLSEDALAAVRSGARRGAEVLARKLSPLILQDLCRLEAQTMCLEQTVSELGDHRP